MSASSRTVSTWAPLRIGLFRAIWLAVLVSNVASWMQTVGAQWLLVGQPHASILVALVQTADYLPDVLFGLVGGVLADTFDRRRLLMAVQGLLAIVGAALAALTFAGQMPPALLLTFTFLIGSASVVTLPAYQAIVPDLVPRNQLHSAAALSSISINLARAVGPAIAGVVIARAGVGAVFALNTAMYLLFLLVLVAWRPPSGAAAADTRQQRTACLRRRRQAKSDPRPRVVAPHGIGLDLGRNLRRQRWAGGCVRHRRGRLRRDRRLELRADSRAVGCCRIGAFHGHWRVSRVPL
jgi:MFS family permease